MWIRQSSFDCAWTALAATRCHRGKVIAVASDLESSISICVPFRRICFEQHIELVRNPYRIPHSQMQLRFKTEQMIRARNSDSTRTARRFT